jgi:hypothetical protein
MAMQSEDSDYDVLCGPYPKKCISWEMIKMAVDKGFADENPGNLEKFVGDYVFNPVSGGGSIPLGAPVEVLEAGTFFEETEETGTVVIGSKWNGTAWVESTPEELTAYYAKHVPEIEEPTL